jgi:peptidoglycan/LPS O-acetylase OafA/YrhL
MSGYASGRIASRLMAGCTLQKTNNFDLIRLAAALQVAFIHAVADLGVAAPWPLRPIAEWFPGVPIFFFISGFLISRSFEKNSILREYAQNRFLRIYPGLAVCFLVSLASVALTGYFATITVSPADILLWAGAQLSAAQFYNPEFMRHYALGVLNGSTWTITVELQFYVLVPLMYGALRWQRLSRSRFNFILGALIFGFLIVNQAFTHAQAFHSRPLWYKVLGVSFAPWFYMFLVGVMFQRNFEDIQRWLGGKFLVGFVVYCSLALYVTGILGWGFGNSLNPLLFISLAVLIFSAAFSGNSLSDRILHRNDLSYGVYIYHGPVISFLLATGLAAVWIAFPLAVMVTLGLSYASWRLVEKPALNLKRHPLYQHRPATPAPR